jgi:thiol-disulfide isomerase/thioredoxin
MKPGAKYLLAVALTVLLAVGAAAAYKYLTSVTTVPPSSPDNTSAPPAGGRTGAPGNRNAAPDFTVTDGGGNRVSTADLSGKPVILNFWATWCPPCRSELPAFDKLYRQYGNEVSFMMIDLTDGYRETVEGVKKFISENGYTFPVYYDTEGSAAEAYNVSSIPFTVAVGRNGNIVGTHLGAMSEAALEKLIKTVKEAE